MTKVYLSGAISGVPREKCMKRFADAAKAVEAQGFEVVNPTRFWLCRWRWLYRIMGYDLTLLYDLWRLSKCAHIYKIPGWRESRGANIESCWAYHYHIYPLPPRIRASIDELIVDN